MSRLILKMACWRVVNERSGSYSIQGVARLVPASASLTSDIHLVRTARTDFCYLNGRRRWVGWVANDTQGPYMTLVSSQPQWLRQ